MVSLEGVTDVRVGMIIYCSVIPSRLCMPRIDDLEEQEVSRTLTIQQVERENSLSALPASPAHFCCETLFLYVRNRADPDFIARFRPGRVPGCEGLIKSCIA